MDQVSTMSPDRVTDTGARGAAHVIGIKDLALASGIWRERFLSEKGNLFAPRRIDITNACRKMQTGPHMRVLLVSSLLLFKETRFGGAKRLYSFLQGLSRLCEVYTICMDASDEKDAYYACSDKPDRLLLLPDCGKRLPLAKKIFRAPVDMRPNINRYSKEINAFLGGLSFDAAMLAYPLALGFVDTPLLRAIPKVVYLEDDLVLEMLKNEAKTKFSGLMRYARLLRYYQTLLFYRSRLRHIGSWIAISVQEKNVIQSYFPGANIKIVKHGIELGDFPMLPPCANERRIGFIGNYHHAPNAVAINYFLESIAPYLFEKIDGLEIIVAGKNIPAPISGKTVQNPNIIIMEDVSNLTDFYSGNPRLYQSIISGRGLRTKLIECAAYGRPIVSTELGAEGLEELRILVADTKEDFYKHISTLFEDKGCYISIVRENRSLVERFYNNERTAFELFSSIQGHSPHSK